MPDADSDAERSLRLRAEARLDPSEEIDELSAEEARALVHDLGVHQAELEIQNEELRSLTFELEAARDRFRDLFDFAPAGFLSLARDGTVLEANLKASELLGCERSRLLGRRMQEFIDPGSQDRFHLHQQAVADSGGALSSELQVGAVGGKPRDVRVESIPTGDADGGTRVSLVDISERVAAESALQDVNRDLELAVARRTRELDESLHLNAKIADAAPLLLWILEVQKDRVVYTNAAARASLGARSGAALSSDHVVYPSDRGTLAGAIEQVARGSDGGVVEVALRLGAPGSEPRWTESRIVAYERGDEGRLEKVLIASIDVTQLHHAEARMRELRNEATLAGEREHREIAAQLHDSLGQLLPLANTKLALARLKCDEVAAGHLAEAERLIRQANAIATSLTYRLSPLALNEIGLAAGLRSLVREMGRDYGLDVSLEQTATGFRLSAALEFEIYRTVHELLVNTSKHSGMTDAEVHVSWAGPELSVVVEDSGSGFAPEPGRPTGWGLAGAEERLAYLGARLQVRAEPGRGTRATILAPVLRADSSLAVDA